jgi:hypothetical protein
MVRVRQEGEMWKKQGSRAVRFTAVEEFSVQHVAFSWNARFALVGPLAMTVVDELSDGWGRPRVSLAGIPAPDADGVGDPHGPGDALPGRARLGPAGDRSDRELDWKAVDGRTVEVGCDVGDDVVGVRWELDAAGDVARVTGVRPVARRSSRRRGAETSVTTATSAASGLRRSVRPGGISRRAASSTGVER